MRTRETLIRAACGSVLSILVVARLAAQNETPNPAAPIEPIAAIIDAFRAHTIVALGDAHGNEQARMFLRSLVRHPRFAVTVNDIVVEFGNARYQGVVDRFVQGENVPRDSVRQIWENTTVANELPVDEQFFDEVRAINAPLPRSRRLRVLLGDPPIDWREVRGQADHFKWLAMRDSYPAALIQLEVLAKGRKALVVYGQLHFQRKNVMSNLDMGDWRMQTIVSLIERATPAKVFTIWNVDDALAALQPDITSWPAPRLSTIRGTTIGAADVTAFVPSPKRFTFRADTIKEVPRDQWRSLRAEDELDAVLYLGPRSAMKEVPLSDRICANPRYVEERLRRIAVAGIPSEEADRVRRLCGSAAKRK
jgi:hypothetical protein